MKMTGDYCQDAVQVFFHLFIRKAYHLDVLNFQNFSPSCVVFLMILMNPPVKFHDQSMFMAVEVGDIEHIQVLRVGEDGMLSKKLLAHQSPIANCGPEDLFSLGLIPSEFSGVRNRPFFPVQSHGSPSHTVLSLRSPSAT